MSAIPWVGQDIVESKFFTENYTTVYCLSSLLPTIGTVRANALKKENKNVKCKKNKSLSIPPSFMSFLAGLIDRYGYIQITETTKGFIDLKLVISINLKDISTLEYIRSVLNSGNFTIKDIKSTTCELIFNKTYLQEIMFPLFLHHKIFFLTETINYQFNTAMVILDKDIKRFDLIPNINNIAKIFKFPVDEANYVKSSFFKNWKVGFTKPLEYPGVIEYKEKKPLSYKRVKDFEKLCSNRRSYHNLKKILSEQYKNVKV